MFIGHYAPALAMAAHPKAPRLGTLFVAAQLVDFGFFTLVMTGAERMRISPGFTAMNPMDLYHMPWTHSLLGSIGWATGFALLLYFLTRHRTAAIIGAGVVLSHWFLDLLVHAPDLTLAGGPPKLGLGLWNHPAIEMPLELLITFGALGYYLASTRPVRGKGKAALAVLIVLLLAFQGFNWFAPPPTEFDMSIPVMGLLAFTLLTGAAAWLATTRTRKGVL